MKKLLGCMILIVVAAVAGLNLYARHSIGAIQADIMAATAQHKSKPSGTLPQILKFTPGCVDQYLKQDSDNSIYEMAATTTYRLIVARSKIGMEASSQQVFEQMLSDATKEPATNIRIANSMAKIGTHDQDLDKLRTKQEKYMFVKELVTGCIVQKMGESST